MARRSNQWQDRITHVEVRRRMQKRRLSEQAEVDAWCGQGTHGGGRKTIKVA